MSESDVNPSSGFPNLVDLVRWRSLHDPERLAFIFLTDDEAIEDRLTYRDLDLQARAIAARLQGISQPGDRALLLYLSEPEYIRAFFGCLYAGVIAVPASPPVKGQFQRTLHRLQAVAIDAQATVVLTTEDIKSMADLTMAQVPELKSARWITTDHLACDLAAGWVDPRVRGETLAFLQYSSGSTSTPKGVKISHENVLYNVRMIQRAFDLSERSVGVGWLPLYHDMGLVAMVLTPVCMGALSILMSPSTFQKRPLRWLKAISHYRATFSGGPNFAYDLCVRRIPAAQRASLDLRTWRIAFNASEPLQHQTLERFAAAFGPCGFHKQAFCPGYGLAEATLFVSVGPAADPPMFRTFESAALEQNRVVEVPDQEIAEPLTEGTRILVGCGADVAGPEDRHCRHGNPDAVSLRPSRRDLDRGSPRGPGVLEPARRDQSCVPRIPAGHGRRPVSAHRRFGISVGETPTRKRSSRRRTRRTLYHRPA